MKLTVDLTPDALQQLRIALAPTPAEIDAIALALVERMKREQMQSTASMTVREFAAQARLSTRQVHRLIQQGSLQATKPAGGGDMRVTAAAAAKYFAGGEHGDGD